MKPRIGHGHVYNRQQQIPNPNPNRTTFMPILCSRSMIKNVHVPNSKCQRQPSAGPSSPKIGCMGQVNRTNVRINGFPTPPNYRLPSSSAANNTNTNGKYPKLKRIFSGRTERLQTSGVQSCREIRSNSRQGNSWVPPAPELVNVADMDPPLPVVRRRVQPTRPDGREEVSLWKRRTAGIALKSLQISG